jgi:hypothetical protein
MLMRVVEALDLPIPELLLGIGTYNLKLRNPINHVHRDAKPINLIIDRKL